jgi:hypothetical protein
MRTRRVSRRIATALLAVVAVLGATLVTVTVPGVAGAQVPHPDIPDGSVRIPATLLTVQERVVTYTHETNGPEGFCYLATFLVFDGDTYGMPESTPDTVSVTVYNTDPGHPDPVSTKFVSKGPKPVNVTSTNPLFGRVAYDGDQYAMPLTQYMSHGYFNDYTDFRRSECSPTRWNDRHVQPAIAYANRLELWTNGPIDGEPTMDVTVGAEVDGRLEIGDRVPITVSLANPNSQEITGISLGGGSGLRFSEDHLALVDGPDVTAPTTLAPGASATLRYEVEVLASGNLEVAVQTTGTYDGEPIEGRGAAVLPVPPKLTMGVRTSVTNQTKVGDEFTVTATLTNTEDVDITGVRAEPLSTRPMEAVSPVSGPTGPTGSDPRVDPVTVPAGGSVDITWVYRAEQKGTVALTAQVSGRDPREGSTFFLSAETSVAIEAPALEITDLRLQPGSIVPGDFGNLRGTVTNIGSVDVTGIDVALESNPHMVVIQRLLNELDASISPRIPSLAVDESREFLIPVGMQIDAGGLATYTADVTLAGTAEIDGEDVDVAATARTSDDLELSLYWTTIWDEVKRKLLDDTLDFFDGVNAWGDSSTLGGVTVGGGQGVLNAFQKLGDGLLTVNDLLGEVSGDGGQRLTEEGRAIAAAAREYLHTTSAQKMAVDLANLEENVAVGGVGVFAEWLRDIDRAAEAGDSRRVAELISEPATEIAVGFGVEQAGARLFTKLIRQPMVRQTVAALKRAPDPVTDGPDVPYDRLVTRELQDLKDMPTGVPLTGETVARAGITADEHGWMIDVAKEHGVAFFVRPRPEDAARWARLGYNAKPMAIKLKSINEIDAKWLGFDDYADSHGLVVLREPADPFPAMKEAVERGELEWGGKEIDDIIERYNLRKAEWESRDALLEKLNAGDGFEVQRYGKTIRTKVTIDADGLLRFTHNDKPIYSDIDLLSVAYPDGTALPPELHQQIMEAAGFGLDGQHGDSVMTSDFPNWPTAKKFAVQYAGEHMRGGDPLIIVQPDVTTLGYVDSIDVPSGDVAGSGYDLFAKITTTYEGAGVR